MGELTELRIELVPWVVRLAGIKHPSALAKLVDTEPSRKRDNIKDDRKSDEVCHPICISINNVRVPTGRR